MRAFVHLSKGAIEPMDPNAALSRIRELVEANNRVTDASRLDIADELAELIDGLDNWLSRGGFPPDAWDRSKMHVR
jgi:hypothetical protein